MTYIKPDGKQLFERYNNGNNGDEDINWVPIGVTFGLLVLVGFSLYIQSKNKEDQISRMFRNQNILYRKTKNNEQAIGRIAATANSNTESIAKIKSEIEELKLAQTSNSDPWV